MVSNKTDVNGSPHSPDSGGYLFCSGCGGYYELKEGESPDDFDQCECGAVLEYCKDKAELESKYQTEEEPEPDVYEALANKKEVLELLETKVRERREFLRELAPPAEVDEDFFLENQEEWDLWETLDQKSSTDYSEQKKLLDVMVENDRLNTVVGSKRSRIRNPTLLDQIKFGLGITDFLVVFGIIIIIALCIILILVSYW